MKSASSNPSRIRHNPSRRVTDSTTKQAIWDVCGEFSVKSVTNPSRVFVTDFRRRKSHKNKEKLSLSLSIFKSVTHPLAMRVRLRAGVVTDSRDGFSQHPLATTGLVAAVQIDIASTREFSRVPCDTHKTDLIISKWHNWLSHERDS